jgi:hypothetical protein
MSSQDQDGAALRPGFGAVSNNIQNSSDGGRKRPVDQLPHGVLMATTPQKASITSQIIAAENPRSLDHSNPS